MCEDKYDTLVVDVGCVMGDMREELNVLSELMEEDAKNYLQYHLQYEALKKYHDRLNEIL
jgi:hypothetical protein